ncbi:tRNA threonylcarbamoyladenosine dehydratase [Trichinella pseudospiralis]
MEMTAQVINQCTTSLSQAVQGALSSLGALKQMVRRRRNKLGTPLRVPNILDTVIIPEEFTTYAPHCDELVSFLLADSCPSPQRILIFVSQRKVAILRELRTCEALGGVHPVLYLMWLIYYQAADGDSCTNNCAEAAYRRLIAELGMVHLAIWKLIDSLRKVQHSRD